MIRFVECKHQIINLPLLIPIAHAAYERRSNQVIRLSLKDSEQKTYRTDILLRDYVNGARMDSSVDFLHDFFRNSLAQFSWSANKKTKESFSDLETQLLALWMQDEVQSHLSVFAAFDLLLRDACDSYISDTKSVERNKFHPIDIRVLPILKTSLLEPCLQYFKTFQIPVKIKVPPYKDGIEDWMKVLKNHASILKILDFNASWSEQEARSILEVHPFLKKMTWEQSFSKDLSWKEQINFHQEAGIDFMMDESLCTLKDALDCMEVYESKDSSSSLIWNLRIAKNGGLTGIKYLQSLAQKKGIACHLGCFVGEGKLLRKYHRIAYPQLDFVSFDRNPWWLSPFGI